MCIIILYIYDYYYIIILKKYIIFLIKITFLLGKVKYTTKKLII